MIFEETAFIFSIFLKKWMFRFERKSEKKTVCFERKSEKKMFLFEKSEKEDVQLKIREKECSVENQRKRMFS